MAKDMDSSKFVIDDIRLRNNRSRNVQNATTNNNSKDTTLRKRPPTTTTTAATMNNRPRGTAIVHASSTIFPIIALLTSQLLTSSWHVLGKHVLHTVPYVTPITYVLIRTGVTACMLLTAGRICEGRVNFPPLFLNVKNNECVAMSPMSGGSVGLTLTPSAASLGSIATSSSSLEDKTMELLPISSSSSPTQAGFLHKHMYPYRQKDQQYSNTSRRKKRKPKSTIFSFTTSLPLLIRSIPSILFLILKYPKRKLQQTIIKSQKQQQQQQKQWNTEAIQIIAAGLSGMLLLPLTYTTGLVLTTPTVASVWDGPMIPLGCFLAAVGLGMEKRSELWPRMQVGSLALAVGGSLVVLLIDYTGGGGSKSNGEDGHGGGSGEMHSRGKSDHWEGRTTHEFLQGNMVLMGVVASYSAMALLQKRLNHHPPMTLTGWMFGIGFLGCICLVLLDSLLIMIGINISGCTLRQCLEQIYRALSTSPTFRYGLLYSCFFVGAVCFSIASYAASHLESSVITLFAACQPPMTAVLEWIWEGKGLGWKKIGGMVCVGVGMWIFTYIKRVEKEKMDMNRHSKHQSGKAGDFNIQISNDMNNDQVIKQNGIHSLTNRTKV